MDFIYFYTKTNDKNLFIFVNFYQNLWWKNNILMEWEIKNTE